MSRRFDRSQIPLLPVKNAARQKGEPRKLGAHRLLKLAGFLHAPSSGISVDQTGDQLIDCGFDSVQLGLFAGLL
jgi:hypothetical protein